MKRFVMAFLDSLNFIRIHSYTLRWNYMSQKTEPAFEQMNTLKLKHKTDCCLGVQKKLSSVVNVFQ